MANAQSATASAAPRMPLGIAIFMLFVTGVAYGLTYSLATVSVNHGIPFIAYAFWLGLGAGLAMLILSFILRDPPRFTGAHVRGYLVTGVVGFAIPYVIVAYVAGKGVPAGIISMIVALAPLFTYLGAVMFGLDRAWWVKFLGLIIGMSGIALIVVPETSLPSRDLVPWILLCLGMPLGYAATSIAAALLRPPASGSAPFSAGFFLGAAAVLLVVMLASGQTWWFDLPLDDGEWALILSALVQALGIYLFIEIVGLMGPVFFTTVNFITPITGILWGMAFFGERLSFWVLIALIPLFLGVFFVMLRRQSPA